MALLGAMILDPRVTGDVIQVVRTAGDFYSAAHGAVFTEYYMLAVEPDGNQYLNITWFLEDPQYLAGPFIRTVHFKKEPNDAKWTPTPCSAR